MKIITEVEDRETEYNSRMIILPLRYFEVNLFEEDIDTFPYSWMYSYSVHKDDALEAKAKVNELWELLESGLEAESSKIQKKLEELRRLKLPTWEEATNSVRWQKVAMAMPQDIAGTYKDEVSALVSEITYGNVLEAMCGFNSYVWPHLDKSVVAHDYCEKMLKKYEFPRRKRVLFDINELPYNKLYFQEGTFDFVTFTKGYKYVDSPDTMFNEWFRVLKPGGKLVFIESTTASYRDIVCRDLVINSCKEEMSCSGFKNVSSVCLPFRDDPYEDVVLFQGQK